MMDPACKVNREKHQGKKRWERALEEGTITPLNLDPYEMIEVDYPMQNRTAKTLSRYWPSIILMGITS